MGVEDVHVLESEPFEAGIQAAEHVLPRAAVAVGSGPHVVARLGGDDQLIAIGKQVTVQNLAGIGFRCPVRRSVVVGQIKVGHPEVEGPGEHGADLVHGSGVAEVLPESERDQGELEAAAPASAVLHPVVALFGWEVGHAENLDQSTGDRYRSEPGIVRPGSATVTPVGRAR